MVVGGLVLVAVGLLVVIFLAINFGGEQSASAPDSVLPTTAADNGGDADVTDPEATADEATPDSGNVGETGSTVLDTDAPAPAAATIAGVRTYDPDGDFVEEDELVDAVLDGDPSTSWTTTCYANEWMGGKYGVGVVVSLDTPDRRGLLVDVRHAPSLIEFYATDAETVPASFDGWGAPLATSVGTEADVVSAPAPERPARHLLVVVRQLGEHGGCSADNPYRGEIGEIRLAG